MTGLIWPDKVSLAQKQKKLMGKYKYILNVRSNCFETVLLSFENFMIDLFLSSN